MAPSPLAPASTSSAAASRRIALLWAEQFAARGSVALARWLGRSNALAAAAALLWLARTHSGRAVADVVAVHAITVHAALSGSLLAIGAARAFADEAVRAPLDALVQARGLEFPGDATTVRGAVVVACRAVLPPGAVVLAVSLAVSSTLGVAAERLLQGLLGVLLLAVCAALAVALGRVAAHAGRRATSAVVALLLVPELLRAGYASVPSAWGALTTASEALIRIGSAS